MWQQVGEIAKVQMEICENCSAPIGKLETPFVWQDRIVCASCHTKLAGQEQLPEFEDVAPMASLTYASAMPSAHAFSSNDIICPNLNCGYRGAPLKRPRGSWMVGIFLLLLCVLPGLVYAIVCGGHELLCPRCGMKIRNVWMDWPEKR